jgi:hypothetical protein
MGYYLDGGESTNMVVRKEVIMAKYIYQCKLCGRVVYENEFHETDYGPMCDNCYRQAVVDGVIDARGHRIKKE